MKLMGNRREFVDKNGIREVELRERGGEREREVELRERDRERLN